MAAARLSHYTARKRNSIVFVPVTRVIGPPSQNRTIQLSLRTLGGMENIVMAVGYTSSCYRVRKQQQTTEKRQRKQAFYPPLPLPCSRPASSLHTALHHLNKSKKCRLTQYPHYASWLSKIDDVLMQILLHKRNTILKDKQGVAAG